MQTSLGSEYERMTRMSKFLPMPFEMLLLIFGFALLIGWGRWHGMTRNQSPLSKKAKWVTSVGLLTVFALLAALNAIQNHRIGTPQF